MAPWLFIELCSFCVLQDCELQEEDKDLVSGPKNYLEFGRTLVSAVSTFSGEPDLHLSHRELLTTALSAMG